MNLCLLFFACTMFYEHYVFLAAHSDARYADCPAADSADECAATAAEHTEPAESIEPITDGLTRL